MTTETKLADPAILTAKLDRVDHLLFEMENSTISLTGAGQAIYMAGHSMEEKADAEAITWLSGQVKDLAKKIEDSRVRGYECRSRVQRSSQG